MARTKAEVKALIAGAKRPHRLVPVAMRLDLAAECEQLERRLVDLELEQSGPAGSLSGSPEAREVAERIQALRAEMQDSVIEFRLEGLPAKRSKGGRPTWDQLKDAHPPREGNKRDVDNGVDMDAFNEALLRQCIVDPVLDDEDYEALLEALTDGTFTVLIGHCYGVNQQDVEIPFSSAASRILRSSGSE